MGEHVFPFIIDGERVGLTERQYGARLARQAQIDLARYYKEHPAVHSPKVLFRRNAMKAEHWFIRGHACASTRATHAAARNQSGGEDARQGKPATALRICCQHGHVIKSRATGIRARYEAAPD